MQSSTHHFRSEDKVLLCRNSEEKTLYVLITVLSVITISHNVLQKMQVQRAFHVKVTVVLRIAPHFLIHRM